MPVKLAKIRKILAASSITDCSQLATYSRMENTSYTELTLTGPEEILELLPSILFQHQFYGFHQEEAILFAYCNKKDYNPQIVDSLLKKHNLDDKVKVQVNSYPNENWNAKWEASFDPVFIEKSVVIRAPFHTDFPDYPMQITLAPKMAFGTGHHETTYLMLKSMLPVTFKNKKVLDYGCGTSVLAIYAALAGSREILAIDNNPFAIENSLENIQLNNVSEISVNQAEITDIPPSQTFDIILANITRNVILRSIKDIVARLNNDGILVTSGYFHKDLEIIKSESNKYGLTFLTSNTKGSWVTATFISD